METEMNTSLPRHGGESTPSAATLTTDDELAPSQWQDRKLFLRHWLRAPGVTGAMLPSSRTMARTMGRVLDDYDLPTVAELGPGTGAVTAVIQQRLRGRSPHLALEVHQAFADRLRSRYPQVEVVNDSAEQLRAALAEAGLESLDVVISGLPFTAFAPRMQDEILDAVVSCLHPDGVFATHRYLGAGNFPSAQRFRRRLDKHFAEVSISRPTFGNVPPVRLLTARRPRKTAALG